MIGQLTGTVARIDEDAAILEVGGVGYEISATPRLLSQLNVGGTKTLAIETMVAETYFRLVGFESEPERQAFRLLQTVQGVGAKAALSILHVLSPDDLLNAIAAEDKTTIARAQGVGPKLAARIASELQGKTGSIFRVGSFRPPPSDAPVTSLDGARRDAISALINLGYDEGAARRAIGAVPAGDDETVSDLITTSLKALAAS